VNAVEAGLWWRILGWALVIVAILLAAAFGERDTPCVTCGRPARRRDFLGRPVCYLHGQVRR